MYPPPRKGAPEWLKAIRGNKKKKAVEADAPASPSSHAASAELTPLTQMLKAAGGSIVNTASMLSFFGSPYAPAYAASKGGVAQLTKSLAAAWAADGIRVNAIAPGWIATDLTRALQEDEARTQAILSRTPIKRWGQPDDLAGVVAFLASDAAKFVTGVVMPIDGGYLTL